LRDFCNEVPDQTEEGTFKDPSSFSLREMEKNLIFRALEKTNGNRTHAAKILGISIRTLRNKLHEYKEGLPVLELSYI
jgi:two-component system response regulator FlrC